MEALVRAHGAASPSSSTRAARRLIPGRRTWPPRCTPRSTTPSPPSAAERRWGRVPGTVPGTGPEAGCGGIGANPFRAHPRYIDDQLLGRRAQHGNSLDHPHRHPRAGPARLLRPRPLLRTMRLRRGGLGRSGATSTSPPPGGALALTSNDGAGWDAGGTNRFGDVGRQEAFGYLVWLTAGAVVAIPEAWSALGDGDAPWPTISGTIGELEYRHPWTALARRRRDRLSSPTTRSAIRPPSPTRVTAPRAAASPTPTGPARWCRGGSSSRSP